MSINPLQALPIHIQSAIFEQLDSQSLLEARHSCRLLRSITDQVIGDYFENECGCKCLALNQDTNASFSENGRLNMRIIAAAKEAWKSSLEPIQYRRIRPLLAHEMGQLRPSHPVNIRLNGFNSFFMFSKEGSREQTSILNVKSKQPLSIEIAEEEIVTKEFPVSEFGVVKDMIQGENGFCMLVQNNSSLSLIFESNSSKKIDLKVENVVAYHLTENRLILCGEAGDLYDYKFDEDDTVVLKKTIRCSKPVRWVQSLNDGSLVYLVSDALYLIRSGQDVHECLMQKVTVLPKLLQDGIVLMQQRKKLFWLNPLSSLDCSLIKCGVTSWVSLGKDSLLLMTKDGTLERYSSSQLLSSIQLSDHKKLAAACCRENLIAVAFTSGELMVFEERENVLNKIYEIDCFKNKPVIHALLFDKTFELLITTKDGGIFAIRPFSISEKKSETYMDVIKRFFNFT